MRNPGWNKALESSSAFGPSIAGEDRDAPRFPACRYGAVPFAIPRRVVSRSPDSKNAEIHLFGDIWLFILAR